MATTNNYAVVVHGGVGEPLHYTDGCRAGADAAPHCIGEAQDAPAAMPQAKVIQHG